MTGCVICKRELEDGKGRTSSLTTSSPSPPSSSLRKDLMEFQANLCKYHVLALERLSIQLESWKRAYGEDEVTWASYLERVKNQAETGLWVKEVAQALLTIERTKKSGSL